MIGGRMKEMCQGLLNGGPFVVTVASEKGGVGKTTIATNLAVYLKALCEDLPVTIASFDNHFSVDSMFAIGNRRGVSVAELFTGTPPEEMSTLGEYGVAYLASERILAPPDADPFHLRRNLAGSGLKGVLILDTRPILDYFTRNALLAADLVLTPVKDRASLVNAAALQAVLANVEGGPDRLWLVPSLIDGRLKLRENLGMLEFLIWASRERDYQVFPAGISKSPKVESLATGFSSRVHPILTHARGTAVHGQFRLLGEFVLERLAALAGPLAHRPAPIAPEAIPSRLLEVLCPGCASTAPVSGHFFQALRSRRRGFLHQACVRNLLNGSELLEELPEGALLAVIDDEDGQGIDLILFDENGQELVTARAEPTAAAQWRELFGRAAGRFANELYRECLLVGLGNSRPEDWRDPCWRSRFAGLRRQVLSELSGRSR